MTLVGVSLPRLEGESRVTGSALFGDDLFLPGMLIAKILRSPHAHAEIISVDVSEALAVPGVVAIVTGKDKQYIFGENKKDEYPLATDKVRYVGDEVAAVAAIDEGAATEALKRIKVEYRKLPVVYDPEKALEEDAPQLHTCAERNTSLHVDFVRGDVEKMFAEADLVVEGKFETSNIFQGYLEPVTALAVWEANQLKLHTAVQSPYRTRLNICDALGLALSQVRIICPAMGGGFGGKVSTNIKAPIIASMLAIKSKKPVKLTLSREEDMEGGRPRPKTIVRSKLALKKDGTFLAKKTDIIMDNGAYTGFAHPVLKTMAIRSENIYRFQACDTRAALIYTNKTPTGPYRGFGTPMGLFVLESLVDMAAKKLGMDPIDIRLKNVAQKGDTTLHGYVFNTCGLKECLQTVRKMRESDKRSADTVVPEYIKKGYGLALCIHNSGNRLSFGPFDASTAVVRIEEDGHVFVLSGEQDIGQGSDSTFAQIAAEVLGVSYPKVKVFTKDTDFIPFGLGTFASRVTLMGGNAVKIAAEEAKAELLKEAAYLLECTAEELDIQEDVIKSKLQDSRSVTVAEAAKSYLYRNHGRYITKTSVFHADTEVDPKTLYGNPSLGYCFGVQLFEVEVDTETGKVTIPKAYIAYDVGKVLNPIGAEGQLEGGIAQGIGMGITEKCVYTSEGKLWNPNLTDYRMMNIADMPETQIEFIETNEPNGPFGAKSVSEAASDPTPAAIANAITDALGRRPFTLPVDPETVISLMKG